LKRPRLGGLPLIRRLRREPPTETDHRKEFAEQAAPFTPYVAVESGRNENERALFFLPMREKSGVDRFAKREWKETRHLQRALDALAHLGIDVPRTTFVDVGAHIGTSAITAVRRFGFRAAVAFEAEATNFRLLRANVIVNDLEAEIEAVNVAVSNRVGAADLKLRPAMGPKHRLLRSGETAAHTVRVPVMTLDKLVEEGKLDPAGVGLLWLDVEGHELEALEGARALRERSVPIVMEFAPHRLRVDGRIDALRALLGEHYTHILDLRHRLAYRPDVRPLDALAEIAEHYPRRFTDLLVLRHPGGPTRAR
jgi:FkbM family methyltransferase